MVKKYLQKALLLLVLCTTATTYAQMGQSPEGIQFQALATDANGHPAAGRVIYVKDAIVAKTATGTIVYSETFKVTASSAGIFTIVLGKGTYASGVNSIANIDWSNGPFFLNLKIAVEPTVPNASWNVNNEYVDLGTSQFWSVPYALYAGNVKGADGKLNTSDTATMLKPYFSAINLKANIESPTFTGTVSGITKAMVGLDNVDNTSDINKPVSTATQTALDLKANATDVTTALALKSNASDVTTSLALKANLASPTFTGTVAGIDKTMVGLGNVDNTSDLNKPVSTAAQTALDLKAPLASPTLTGTPLAPTAAAGTNTTQLATTQFVNREINTANAVVVPYTGATQAVDLGAHNLTVNGVSVGIGSGAISSNTAIGGSALSKNTTGSNNTANGVYALVNNTTGSNNTANGIYALEMNTSGSNNTSNGMYALSSNTTGDYNTSSGLHALSVNTTGSYNTAIGFNANVATGALTNATAIGHGANVATSNTIQLGNTSITNVKTSGTITADAVTYPKAHGTNGQVLSTTGSGTLAWITPSTTATAYSGVLPIANGGTGASSQNFVDLTTNQTIAGTKTFSCDITVNGVKIGRGNGNNDQNVAVGADALASGTGTRNTAIGYGAMRQYNGTSFDNNTSVGYFNLPVLTSGSGNTSIGAESMMALTTGTENTSIGNQSLINTTGNNNVGVGKRAGQTITTGSQNTIIGTDADVATADITNASAIGYSASVSTSNTIQLGNTSITNVKTSGTITADAVTYPKAHGTAGQVLSTTGSGTLAWTTPSTLYQKTHGDITLSNTVGNMISLNLPAGSYLVTYTGMAYQGAGNGSESVASRIAIASPGNLGGQDAIMVTHNVNDGRAYIVHQLGITLASAGTVSVFANTLYGTFGPTIITGARLTAIQVGAVIDQ